MSADSFIMLLIQLVERRGLPADLHSDDGSNFIYANKELNKWLSNLDQQKINSKLVARRRQRHINPLYASHRGGVWERLMRLMRQLLTVVRMEQILEDGELPSVIVSAERILNNRPIAPVVNSDPEAAALSPSHLLLLRNNQEL